MNFSFNVFKHESKSIESAGYILAVTAISGGFLSILRNALLASHFGASHELDIYFASFKIPDFIYNIFVFGALSAGVIPVFNKYILEGKEKAWQLASATINAFFLILGIAALVVIVFSREIAGLLVPGFSAGAQLEVAALLKIMMLQPMILAVSNVVAGTLQTFKRFLAYSLAPVFYNVGIIIGIVWFSKLWGIAGVAWGVVLGAALHFAIQFPSLLHIEFKYSAILLQMKSGLKEIFNLMIPRSLSLLLSQSASLVIVALASILPAGSITIYTFANNLHDFPLSVFGLSFATAAFPTLSGLWASKNKESFEKTVARSIREIFFWTVPLVFLLWAFRDPMVRILLPYKNDGEAAFRGTANVFAIMLFALPINAVLLLLVRAFFAMGDSMTPLLGAGLAAGVNVAIAVWVAPIWGIIGLSIAFSAQAYVYFIFLLIFLRRRVETLYFKEIFSGILPGSVTGLVAGTVGYGALWLSNFFISSQDYGAHTLRLLLLRLIFAGFFSAAALGVGFFILRVRMFNRGTIIDQKDGSGISGSNS